MRLKCKDGVVRNFSIATRGHYTREWNDAMCLQCGHSFDIHDTKILKPMFISHICEECYTLAQPKGEQND